MSLGWLSDVLPPAPPGARGPGYNLLRQPSEENPNSLLENEEVEDQWKFMARDLDSFFSGVYDYYRERGFHCICVANILNLLLLAFVNYVTATLLLFIDWERVLECRAHNGCEDITEFVTGHTIMRKGTVKELLALLFVLGITAWWCIQLVSSVQKIKDAKDIQRFYQLKLELSDSDLLSMDWSDVVDVLVQRQASLTLKEHDALDIANRILRHDNYMVGLVNSDMLPLGLPTISCPFPIPRACIPVSLQLYLGDSIPEEISIPTPPDFLPVTLYLTIKHCLLDKMFDSNFHIPEKFLGIDGASELRRRFRLMGVIMAVMSPFIALAMVMYIILKHAEIFYKKPSYVVQRRWSHAAKWKFREWNEMPHVFERRMKASYDHADRYVNQWHSELVSLCARFLTFVGGSFAGLCFVLIMINDSLMSTTMYDRNLWWYLAVCGAILGVTRSAALPPPYGDDAKECFKNVQKWTHFGDGPDELGSKDPRSAEVIGQFKQLYSPRFSTVLQEFVAILSTPIMLWTVYPKNAARILSFIRENTEQVDTIGDVCGFATFNFEKYGDKAYGAQRSEYTVHSKRPAREGKMEKSFVNFKASNPGWRPTAAHAGLHAFSDKLTESVVATPRPAGGDSVYGEESLGGSTQGADGVGERMASRGLGGSSLLLFEQAEYQQTLQHSQSVFTRPTTDSMLSAFGKVGDEGGLSLLDSQYMVRHDQGYEALERVHEACTGADAERGDFSIDVNDPESRPRGGHYDAEGREMQPLAETSGLLGELGDSLGEGQPLGRGQV